MFLNKYALCNILNVFMVYCTFQMLWRFLCPVCCCCCFVRVFVFFVFVFGGRWGGEAIGGQFCCRESMSLDFCNTMWTIYVGTLVFRHMSGSPLCMQHSNIKTNPAEGTILINVS